MNGICHRKCTYYKQKIWYIKEVDVFMMLVVLTDLNDFYLRVKYSKILHEKGVLYILYNKCGLLNGK